MRIQLSTVFLVIALIAILTGWLVERQKWESERARLMEDSSERDVNLFVGFSTFANTNRSTNIFYELSELSDDEEMDYAEFMKTQLVSDLLEIFTHQKELKICSETRAYANFEARSLSRNVLKQLGCKTTDQFFETATSLEKYSNPSYYPELHDSHSDEHNSLRKHVESAILILDQLLPGPYAG